MAQKHKQVESVEVLQDRPYCSYLLVEIVLNVADVERCPMDFWEITDTDNSSATSESFLTFFILF